jgi:conjugal transfer pilus assembly protein TraV
MKHTLALACAVFLLTACGSQPRVPNYECPLQGADRARCASVQDSLEASRAMDRTVSARMQSVFDARATSRQDGPAAFDAPGLRGQAATPPVPTTGAPVFQQPRVMRVWVAPYVDADGNLRSGEFVYFATPGSWNYGTLRRPGSASGIFGPTRPTDLGFTPVTPPARGGAAAPARPPEPGAAAPTPGGGAAQQAPGGITQPYQRLGQ